jgi:hypothetical protein
MDAYSAASAPSRTMLHGKRRGAAMSRLPDKHRLQDLAEAYEKVMRAIGYGEQARLVFTDPTFRGFDPAAALEKVTIEARYAAFDILYGHYTAAEAEWVAEDQRRKIVAAVEEWHFADHEYQMLVRDGYTRARTLDELRRMESQRLSDRALLPRRPRGRPRKYPQPIVSPLSQGRIGSHGEGA